MDYEEAKKRMKKEAQNDNPYTVNRMSSIKKQIDQKYGYKAGNELLKETMSIRKRKYGSQAER